jgi:hypothetical protein
MKPQRVICLGCGEIYSRSEFSKQNPLEFCGECGSDCFLPYSGDCLKGFRSVEQYNLALDVMPKHLRIPPELSPRSSPFA